MGGWEEARGEEQEEAKLLRLKSHNPKQNKVWGLTTPHGQHQRKKAGVGRRDMGKGPERGSWKLGERGRQQDRGRSGKKDREERDREKRARERCGPRR